MQRSLEKIYNFHHNRERGEDFSILKEERGGFLRKQIGEGKKVLDIGCRDGALTSFFCKGNQVLGLDIDLESLERAKNKLGIEIKQIDLNGSWDELSNDFDAVVAAEVIEHLYYPEDKIKKINNVLKTGGLFVGSVPNAFNLKNRVRLFLGSKKHTPLSDPTHINQFTYQELKDLLEKYFIEVKIFPVGHYAWLDRFWPGMFSFILIFSAKKK